MNPAAILTLISDLYTTVAQLREENEALRAELAKRDHQEPSEPSEPTGVEL